MPWFQRSGGLRLPPSTGDLQNSLVHSYIGHNDANVRMAACQVYETLGKSNWFFDILLIQFVSKMFKEAEAFPD